MSYAIEAEGVSKAYSIGKKEEYGSLREEIMESLSSVFKGGRAGGDDTVWALKDVSFKVAEGEALGIIGRNGAGKSTLLKILSRITEPTSGKVVMRGRVASLLEVGTGFHPELTGRENIFLNGALLGMTGAEIRKKFDEIVAFSEIEKFLDTPVKRYSSGMYVRLAFAVAAHLEPEILIIDEVLAVGDAEFQKKCMGKMNDVAGSGRTVLFVSHNMGAVKSLCSSAILLSGGSVADSGAPSEVIEKYLSRAAGDGSGVVAWRPEDAPGGEDLRLISIRILDPSGKASGSVDAEKPISVEVRYELLKTIKNMGVAVQIIDSDGTVILTSTDHPYREETNPAGAYTSVCTIPGGFLNSGNYFIAVHSDCPGIKMLLKGREYIRFHAERHFRHGSVFMGRWPGIVAPSLDWKIENSGLPDAKGDKKAFGA